MAPDDNDDLYDEEFDFVDEDEEPSDVEDGTERDRDATPLDEDRGEERDDREEAEAEEPVDEYGRPEPTANYVVHLYEHKKFKRTIDRAFTPEDAEAFATEYNRTSRLYHRVAVPGKNDAQPKKAIE